MSVEHTPIRTVRQLMIDIGSPSWYRHPISPGDMVYEMMEVEPPSAR